MALFDRPAMTTRGGTLLHVGPAGWSYPDWKGTVYPERRPAGFREPAYLAQFFNVIELNNTFYRPPRPDYCRRWVRDIAGREDFLYTAKLWQRFTHERRPHWSPADVGSYVDGIAPLLEAGRLGAVLVQFPYSFHFDGPNRKYLTELADEFAGLPLVFEGRSRDWVTADALEFIASLGVGFCNIDQPRFRGNIPLTNHAFGDVGYLRLHGRNAATWFSDKAGRDERYDYLYDEKELDELQRAIEEIAAQVERMFVIANNHYRGQAVATGIQLMNRLTDERVEPPGIIRELYDL